MSLFINGNQLIDLDRKKRHQLKQKKIQNLSSFGIFINILTKRLVATANFNICPVQPINLFLLLIIRLLLEGDDQIKLFPYHNQWIESLNQ